MRSKHQAFISVPIPSRVPPEVVLAHIQKYTPMLEHNSVVISFSETTPNVALVLSDPFFGAPNSSVRSFESTERLTLAPGLTRDRKWPVTFQKTPNGIRSRADARAGVIVRTEWLIRPRQDVSTPSSTATLTEEWELYEELIVEASALLMPFVSRTADDVHRTINQKVIDEVARNYLFNGNS